MRKLLLVLSASTLLLTSCSSAATVEPKYDEVDLIRYKSCFEFAVNTWDNASFLNSQLVTDSAIEACEKYLPVKK